MKDFSPGNGFTCGAGGSYLYTIRTIAAADEEEKGEQIL
jgi:hypothetical protein